VNPAEEAFLDRLTDRLSSIPGLEGISLGGSRATERHGPDSDWDLGLYTRGAFPVDAVRALADDAGWPGEVLDEGQWGEVMNGGAWLSIEETSVDLHWRDLDTVERVVADAERGEFFVARIPFHLAPIPSYILLAELAMGRTVWGALPRPGFPDALRTGAAAWWRLNASFDLDYAAKLAAAGEVVVCVGLLSRVVVQEAYARMAERREWSTNEKRIIGDAGLASLADAIGRAGTTPDDLAAAVELVEVGTRAGR
jgi:predicted nucleotidyltransferase